MKRFLGTLMAVAVIGVMPARADTFVYNDPSFGFGISFPDSWTLQTKDVPTTRIRIAAPVGEDLATCRVKATADGRLNIYPKRHMDEAVVMTLDQTFWDGQVNQYDAARIIEYRAPAALGQGDATAIRAAYTLNGFSMSSIMLGTIYDGTRYVMECAARAEIFNTYAPLFGSVIDSFQLDQRYHPFKHGYYRDFLSDPDFEAPKHRPASVVPPLG